MQSTLVGLKFLSDLAAAESLADLEDGVRSVADIMVGVTPAEETNYLKWTTFFKRIPLFFYCAVAFLPSFSLGLPH